MATIPPRSPLAACFAALMAFALMAGAALGGTAPLAIGSLTLRPCPSGPAYCGDFDRPLDPTGAVPGRISIHFEYYVHTAPGKATGTLVATEGGPGFPATESRGEYLELLGPLRGRHDVLLMDNRGTGQSGALDCHELQTAAEWTVELTGACGASLGNGASLYSTAYAADDLAALLEALSVARIDLYGDSYGTYFEQVFAVRHPNLLRSVVLDGAYPLNGPDYAWYPSYAPAMRAKFDLACRRFAPCADQPGSSIDHIRPLLLALREHPFAAHAADSDGKQRDFTANAARLAIVMYGSAPAFATVRELDAAASAFLNGDQLPVLRLMAETITAVDSRDPTANVTKWSAGLAAAVMCQDPPQIFDMRLAPLERIAQRDRVIADRQRTAPDTYAPFSIDEYRGMPLDYSFIDQCVTWPVAPPNHPASNVVAADARYPDVPALILSGELDNMTTMADGAAVAAAFARGRQVRIANSFHVNALPHARSDCGARIVRHFIESLEPGDVTCAEKVAPLRLAPPFVLHAADANALQAMSGNTASPEQLRLAAAALDTIGDVIARLPANSGGRGVGLRGGSFEIEQRTGIVHVALDQVRWADDLAVSGTIDKPAGRTGVVRSMLTLEGGHLAIRWTEGSPDDSATITGNLNGTAVAARARAP